MKKIVLVDDYVDLIETLKEYIERKGDFECTIFLSPLEALRHVLENDVDVVVSDYEMPRMNGFEFIKDILSKKPEIKAILMSGHDEVYLKKIAKNYSVDESKVKFLDKMDVLKKLPEILNE